MFISKNEFRGVKSRVAYYSVESSAFASGRVNKSEGFNSAVPIPGAVSNLKPNEFGKATLPLEMYQKTLFDGIAKANNNVNEYVNSLANQPKNSNIEALERAYLNSPALQPSSELSLYQVFDGRIDTVKNAVPIPPGLEVNREAQKLIADQGIKNLNESTGARNIWDKLSSGNTAMMAKIGQLANIIGRKSSALFESAKNKANKIGDFLNQDLFPKQPEQNLNSAQAQSVSVEVLPSMPVEVPPAPVLQPEAISVKAEEIPDVVNIPTTKEQISKLDSTVESYINNLENSKKLQMIINNLNVIGYVTAKDAIDGAKSSKGIIDNSILLQKEKIKKLLTKEVVKELNSNQLAKLVDLDFLKKGEVEEVPKVDVLPKGKLEDLEPLQELPHLKPLESQPVVESEVNEDFNNFMDPDKMVENYSKIKGVFTEVLPNLKSFDDRDILIHKIDTPEIDIKTLFGQSSHRNAVELLETCISFRDMRDVDYPDSASPSFDDLLQSKPELSAFKDNEEIKSVLAFLEPAKRYIEVQKLEKGLGELERIENLGGENNFNDTDDLKRDVIIGALKTFSKEDMKLVINSSDGVFDENSLTLNNVEGIYDGKSKLGNEKRKALLELPLVDVIRKIFQGKNINEGVEEIKSVKEGADSEIIQKPSIKSFAESHQSL